MANIPEDPENCGDVLTALADLSRDLGRPLSEIIPNLSVEGKARVLDMLIAHLEERERAPKEGIDDATHS